MAAALLELPAQTLDGHLISLMANIEFPAEVDDALGRLQRADIHHIPWPLEEAEAEITQNDLAAHIGLTLPDSKPLLHYSRHLAVYVWPAELVLAKVVAAGPVVAAAQ